MATFVLRVWLADRPGALGAVATRVGAVRGDVVGIDIIDRGAGRAIDELVVELPDAGLVDLLLAEIAEVDGVDVEHVRALDATPEDPSVLALEVARRVHAAVGDGARCRELVEGASRLLSCDWAALVDPAARRVVHATGEGVPDDGWLCAFVLGATATEAAPGLSELAVAELPSDGTVLVVSRTHSPLRGREQRVLQGLADLLGADPNTGSVMRGQGQGPDLAAQNGGR